MDRNMYKYFELDQNVGTLRTKFSTFDYESFTLNIILCNFEEFIELNRYRKVLSVNIEVKRQYADSSS